MERPLALAPPIQTPAVSRMPVTAPDVLMRCRVTMGVTIDRLGDNFVGCGLLATGERLDPDDSGEQKRHHCGHQSFPGQHSETSEAD